MLERAVVEFLAENPDSSVVIISGGVLMTGVGSCRDGQVVLASARIVAGLRVVHLPLFVVAASSVTGFAAGSLPETLGELRLHTSKDPTVDY